MLAPADSLPDYQPPAGSPAATTISAFASPRAVSLPADPLSILHEVFGYPAFRGDQAAIVEHVIGGGDALVLMPTGGGKSLCYQVPALLRPGTGIVVSPLIALMADQVAALESLGIRDRQAPVEDDGFCRRI